MKTSTLFTLRRSAALAICLPLLAVGCRNAGDPAGNGGPGLAPLAGLLGPAPTATPLPTEIPPTPTPRPTTTPAPFPLSIGYLRARAYEGSDVTIEETLKAGSNYDRFLASYLSDGLKIKALLTVPRGPKPATGWPVVIFNHGYIPPRQYRTTERYVAYADAFARAGYIVFKSDYRGHGDSKGSPSGAYGSPDYCIDVLNALATMRRYPDADPQRIGMWGHSMGGYITLRAMVTDPGIKAGVIWAGVVASYPDLLTRWRRTPNSVPTPAPGQSRRWRSDLEARFGPPDRASKTWAALSANSFLADLSGPLQLHHGTEDHSVPLEFSRTLEEQLVAVDRAADLFVYEGDDHNLSQNLSVALRRSVAFFDEFVKGKAN